MKATMLIAAALVAGLPAVLVLAQVTPTDEKVPCHSYDADDAYLRHMAVIHIVPASLEGK